MANNGTIKNLSKALQLSEGFLKGIAKGNKRGQQDFLTMNTANACRSVAFFTGYPNKERAEKAIRNNISQLYTSSVKVANSILKVADKYSKEKREILIKAAEALKADNYTEFNRLIKSNKELGSFKRKCAKNLNKKLLEAFRNSPKTDSGTAKKLLMAQKSPNGYKIVVPQAKIQKEISKRLKRFGAVASLFWQAAKQLNPKIKPSDSKHTLIKEKRKKHKMTNGMTYRSQVAKDGATATMNHKAEGFNQKFKSKLIKRIANAEKFWSKVAGKEIVACGVLDKLINKA